MGNAITETGRIIAEEKRLYNQNKCTDKQNVFQKNPRHSFLNG
jgi:hypothetical protein